MTKRADFYIYALFRESGIPFYIGKGCNRRIDIHLHAHPSDNSRKRAIIVSMRKNGKDVPRAKLAEGLTEEDAFRMETAFIKAIGRAPDGPLVNHSDGGEGPSNPSAETRLKMRMAKLGRKLHPETIDKIRQANIGKKMSPQAIERTAAYRRGRQLSAESRAKMSAAQKGKKRHTPEMRAYLGAVLKAHPPSMAARARGAEIRRGKKRTLEAVEKTAAKLRGKPQTEAAKAARRAAWHTSDSSKAHLAKICAANNGTKRSPESIANMKLAWARRKAKKAALAHI